MKILFMGTPDFACPTLRVLIKEDSFNVIAVFTQPDSPKGRGRIMQSSPVKRLAVSLKIRVFQPQNLAKGEIRDLWAKLSPDVVVVVAYGRILSSWILHSTPMGCVNLHGSLLPKYRGAAPINWPIINGDNETGVTTMLMDEGVDTGPILLKASTLIQPQDTAGTLHDRLSELGAELMIRTLKEYADGRIVPSKQPESGSSYAPKLNKEIGRLDWHRDNISLWNLIRGINPLPGAFTFLNGQMIKIWRSTPVTVSENDLEPGMICDFDPALGLIVQTGSGKIALEEVQPESKKKMTAKAFINGCRFNPIGKIFKRFRNEINDHVQGFS